MGEMPQGGGGQDGSQNPQTRQLTVLLWHRRGYKVLVDFGGGYGEIARARFELLLRRHMAKGGWSARSLADAIGNIDFRTIEGYMGGGKPQWDHYHAIRFFFGSDFIRQLEEPFLAPTIESSSPKEAIKTLSLIIHDLNDGKRNDTLITEGITMLRGQL